MTELEQKIDYLIKRWEEDNQYRSDVNIDHVAYKALVSLGPEAIPFLLKSLGRSWLIPCALHAISKETIELRNDEVGMFEAINNAWRKWGQKKGLLKV